MGFVPLYTFVKRVESLIKKFYTFFGSKKPQ